MSLTSRSLAPLLFTLACTATLVPGCSSGGSNRHEFQVRTAVGTVSGATELIVVGDWAAYFASEALTAGGTDLNGDLDTTDDVVRAIHIEDATDVLVGVAADDVAIVGKEFFLSVTEATDGVDWNGVNGMADRVLLHWDGATEVLTFVDTLNPSTVGEDFVATLDRLIYSAAPAALVGDETSLRRIEENAPTTPVVVMNETGAGTLDPVVFGFEAGLVFLLADEANEAADLNGDADMTDAYVLALLDGNEDDTPVLLVGLALADDAAPIAADTDFSGDRLVGFLVDEAAQGGTNLNAPGLFANKLVPDSCDGTPDVDANDQVLHFLCFDDFVLNNTVVNTGLAGRDRIVVVEDALATLSDEADANCNMNGDLDMADTVLRWVSTTTPVAPPRNTTQLFAINTTIPGGAMGVAGLFDRFVAIVDESQDSRNLDGKAQDHDLFGWVDPADGLAAVWTFAHQGARASSGTSIFEDTNNDGLGDPGSGASEPYAGTSWMSGDNTFGRIAATFLEEVPGTNPKVGSLNINLDCAVFFKDADVTDALPVWLDFAESNVLDFDGVGFAVDPANAGMVIAGVYVFFRVNEAQDAIDHNKDGALDDVVLMRNSVNRCDPTFMSTSSVLPGSVVVTNGTRGAAFFCDETLTSEDLNGDGDAMDLVVRYFTF